MERSEPATSRGIAISINSASINQTDPQTLEQLASSGEILSPVGSGIAILDAQLLSIRESKKGVFKFGVLVNWDPKEKLKGEADLIFCDKKTRCFASPESGQEKK